MDRLSSKVVWSQKASQAVHNLLKSMRIWKKPCHRTMKSLVLRLPVLQLKSLEDQSSKIEPIWP